MNSESIWAIFDQGGENRSSQKIRSIDDPNSYILRGHIPCIYMDADHAHKKFLARQRIFLFVRGYISYFQNRCEK